MCAPFLRLHYTVRTPPRQETSSSTQPIVSSRFGEDRRWKDTEYQMNGVRTSCASEGTRSVVREAGSVRRPWRSGRLGERRGSFGARAADNASRRHYEQASRAVARIASLVVRDSCPVARRRFLSRGSHLSRLRSSLGPRRSLEAVGGAHPTTPSMLIWWAAAPAARAARPRIAGRMPALR